MDSGERVLLVRHSGFNMIVVTEDEAGMRTLRFGHEGPRQSVVKAGAPECLGLPYAKVLLLCLAFVPEPRRILIVGLGGGALPGFFRRYFADLSIDIVEIDEAVVEVAKEHCGFQEDARMHVHVGDGRDFIERCSRHYDMIILDSFDAEAIPVHLRTLEFLQAVRAALTPSGMVIGNVWGRSLNRLYGNMLLTYREAFEEVYIFDVPEAGTKIFAGLLHREIVTRDELVQRATRVFESRGFPISVDEVLSGFRRAELEWVKGGEVLRD